MIGHRCAGSRRGVSLFEVLIATAILGALCGLPMAMFSSAQRTADNFAKMAQVGNKKKVKAQKPPNPGAAPNEYIVVFRPGTADPAGEAQRLAELCKGTVL